jgi:hypothetical protein
MAIPQTNVSFDGSPVQFRMDSPLLACFDPLALDMLGELLLPGFPVDVSRLLERANANHPALACFMISDFQPGLYTLDPRDIRKFGNEDDDFDYGEDEQQPDKTVPDYLFTAVDSGTLLLADVAYLPKLVILLTWEQYDRSRGDDTILPGIVEQLGSPYFAVVASDSRLAMEFDGDGTYTIPASCVRRIHG